MRLLSTTDPKKIEKIIKGLQKEAEAITTEIYKICWYLRSISREEAFALSYNERKIIMQDVISENIKRVNETKLPIL
jgi:hypothetical protein